MEKMWKISMFAATILGIACMSFMLFFAMNKSVVTTEEQDLKGSGNLEPLIQTILSEKEKYEYVVLINAAHGGNNKGNTVNELEEKNITLAVGKKLTKMSVEGEIGIFLIREEDTDISNESRAQLVEQVQPDLLIDLHVNADPTNERTFGTAMVYNDDFYRPNITNAWLADVLERELVTEIQGKALGIFSDAEKKYPLLSMLPTPSVSVEMGFLTNKQEAGLLKKDNYQKRIATGIYKGIEKIKEELDKL
ncbi:MAG: N-acetylmuramoyl-L-alanine amidase [Lachnospiraceae bacterium]|nr:N-acetylmuramoyl-L-alanine amidase [Lachnospiraceae bacterium]